MITLSFPQPDVRLSMNDRLHWAQRASRVRAWREATRWAAVAAFPRRHARKMPPCFVRVTFPVKDSRRRDSDNSAPTVKAIVDGLVDAGLWVDDTPDWVESLGSRFAKGATEVVVNIIPRDEYTE